MSRSGFDTLKSEIKNLILDIIEISASRWKIEWGYQIPRMGTHYYYPELNERDSLKRIKTEILTLPRVIDKYSETGIEEPVFSFIKIVLASLPSPERLDFAIEDNWDEFINFLESGNVDVKLLIGLSNITSDKNEYQLGDNIRLIYFESSSLEREMYNLFPLWRKISFPEPKSLYKCNGVIQVDFTMPAVMGVLQYNGYSHECIKRMIPIREALQLSGFGSVFIDPWIDVLNPKLPMNDIVVVSESGPSLSALQMPKLIINQDSWDRFCNIHAILEKLYVDSEDGKEEGRAVRRRFRVAISRFVETYKKGLWESSIVDLIILMESILTPNKQGGRMQLALAASNLLGIADEESGEIYDNINHLYSIRNSHVHGEPTTEEKWKTSLYEIASRANWHSKGSDDDRYIREYAIDVARDYARRDSARIFL